MEKGDYIINKQTGTIAKITHTEFSRRGNPIKLRCVSTTKGRNTHLIGTAYTYQSWTTLNNLEKNWKLLSVEKVLEHLWFFRKRLRQ